MAVKKVFKQGKDTNLYIFIDGYIYLYRFMYMFIYVFIRIDI